MTVTAHLIDDLPPLAWLARARRGDARRITLWHGSGVEVHGDWFFEGAWDDDTGAGRFELTDIRNSGVFREQKPIALTWRPVVERSRVIRVRGHERLRSE